MNESNFPLELKVNVKLRKSPTLGTTVFDVAVFDMASFDTEDKTRRPFVGHGYDEDLQTSMGEAFESIAENLARKVKMEFEKDQPKDYLFEGTVSHGTLLPIDLLNAFVSHLLMVADATVDIGSLKLADEVRTHLQALRDTVANGNEPSTSQNATSSELINDLIAELNAFAPDGIYFGAHEGDGSDFGWWAISEEKDGGANE